MEKIYITVFISFVSSVIKFRLIIYLMFDVPINSLKKEKRSLHFFFTFKFSIIISQQYNLCAGQKIYII